MNFIKEYNEFNQKENDIEYEGPKDHFDHKCIEAFHNGEMVGRVQFKISNDDPPYHEVMVVNKNYRGDEYKIALKLKLLAILCNKKSYYYTKDLTPKGELFIKKYEKRGIWKLDENYERGKLIQLTEKGKNLSIEYGKELLGLDYEFEK